MPIHRFWSTPYWYIDPVNRSPSDILDYYRETPITLFQPAAFIRRWSTSHTDKPKRGFGTPVSTLLDEEVFGKTPEETPQETPPMGMRYVRLKTSEGGDAIYMVPEWVKESRDVVAFTQVASKRAGVWYARIWSEGLRPCEDPDQITFLEDVQSLEESK